MFVHLYAGLCLLLYRTYGIEPFGRITELAAQQWEFYGEADPESSIHLKVIMSNPNDDAFEERALQIATPYSGHYRRHLSAFELAKWTEPPAENVQLVLDWLTAHDISAKQNHDHVQAIMPISKAQKLLNTTYYYYTHEDGRYVRRTDQYHVPSHIAQIIEFVHPTTNFPPKRRRGMNSHTDLYKDTSLSSRDLGTEDLDSERDMPCYNATTPACIEQIYNVDYMAPRDTNVSTETFLTNGVEVNQTNLRIYLERYNPEAAKAHANFTYNHIGKVFPPYPFAYEQDLDVAMLLGQGWPTKVVYTSIQGPGSKWSWGVDPPDNYYRYYKPPPPKKLHHDEDIYIDFLHSLAYKPFVQAVMALQEYELERYADQPYIKYVCKVFGQIGTRGVSTITASGDYGTYASLQHGKYVLQPDFPAGCPWMTTVGGTVYTKDTKDIEKALTFQTRYAQNLSGLGTSTPGAAWFPSGGGFSEVFSRPSWQDADVLKYQKNHDILKKFGISNITGFNPNGRAFPDIAAFGTKIPLIDKGHFSLSGGTSASSPITAAFIARLDAYEQSKGRPPLGFLNVWLYKHPELLNDITCCGNNDDNYNYKHPDKPPEIATGYPVSEGWDAVTGLGSIKFAKMRKALDDLAATGALAA